MGTCPFTNSGGPGGKAGPCSNKSCALYMESVEKCSFKAMGMAIWQTTFGPKPDLTLGDHEPLLAAKREIEELKAALGELSKQQGSSLYLDEIQKGVENAELRLEHIRIEEAARQQREELNGDAD